MYSSCASKSRMRCPRVSCFATGFMRDPEQRCVSLTGALTVYDISIVPWVLLVVRDSTLEQSPLALHDMRSC